MYEYLIKRLRRCEQFRCRECEYEQVMGCRAKLNEEAADAIEQLSNTGSAYGRGWTLGYDAGREESKPRWIPVTERLPKEQETVLTWGEQGIILLNWRHDNKWCGCLGDVTNWMPLPEPPKGETT